MSHGKIAYHWNMCRISKTTRYQTRGLSLAGWGKRWFCILLFSFMHAFLPQFTHDIRHFNSESGASHVLSMSTASQSDTEAGGASLPLALVTDVWGRAHASVTQRQFLDLECLLLLFCSASYEWSSDSWCWGWRKCTFISLIISIDIC